MAYLSGLAATGGWVALAAPEILAIVLPVVLLNALANTGWPSSGGAHYSVSIVPFLIVAAIYGIARLSRWVGGLKGWRVGKLEGWKVGRLGFSSLFCTLPLLHFSNLPLFQPSMLLILLAFAIGLRFQIEQGVAPFSQRWSRLPFDTHAGLGYKILAMIPPDVSISAQSGLYPHLSHREKAYQFPTIADAEYVVLDVTNNPVTLTYDAYFKHVRLALINPRFGPVAAGDGYLLLRRRAPKTSPLVEPFLTFTMAQPEEIERPIKADFENVLRLEGYTLTILPVIDQRGPHVQLTTFWQALRGPPGNLHPVFFYTRADGAGYWRVRGKRQAIYARSNLSVQDRLAAARKL
jgi:hypothetical protein